MAKHRIIVKLENRVKELEELIEKQHKIVLKLETALCTLLDYEGESEIKIKDVDIKNHAESKKGIYIERDSSGDNMGIEKGDYVIFKGKEYEKRHQYWRYAKHVKCVNEYIDKGNKPIEAKKVIKSLTNGKVIVINLRGKNSYGFTDFWVNSNSIIKVQNKVRRI